MRGGAVTAGESRADGVEQLDQLDDDGPDRFAGRLSCSLGQPAGGRDSKEKRTRGP